MNVSMLLFLGQPGQHSASYASIWALAMDECGQAGRLAGVSMVFYHLARLEELTTAFKPDLDHSLAGLLVQLA